MRTGTSERSRIRSSVCQPSSSGMETSRTTRSGGEACSERSPERPSPASLTSNPARLRSSTTRERMSASSSTTRMRAAFIPLSYLPSRGFATGAAEDWRMARILISEPHPDVRVLLEAVVRRAGHEPVDHGELVDEAPELMILEPVSADGLAAAARLRDRLEDLPIICT